MTSVALFRNLNLGHVGSPSGATLVDAFGGPAVAANFQTNGTVVFGADDPVCVAERARTVLDAAGFGQPFVVRSLAELAGMVQETPVVDPAEDVYRVVGSFYDAVLRPEIAVPLRSPDGLVEIRQVNGSWAWSVCWRPRNTVGNVTGFLESLMGVPVTTRTARTLDRLVRKYSATGHTRD